MTSICYAFLARVVHCSHFLSFEKENNLRDAAVRFCYTELEKSIGVWKREWESRGGNSLECRSNGDEGVYGVIEFGNPSFKMATRWGGETVCVPCWFVMYALRFTENWKQDHEDIFVRELDIGACLLKFARENRSVAWGGSCDRKVDFQRIFCSCLFISRLTLSSL